MSIETFAEQYWFFGLLVLALLFAAYLGLFTSVVAAEAQFPGGFFFYKDI